MKKSNSYADVVLNWIISHVASEASFFDVLDVGGGSGSFWREIKSKVPQVRVTIVDPFSPNSAGIQDFADHRVESTFEEVLPSMPSDSFDLVIAVDVIEHLSKDAGYRLMYEMERLARVGVSIYTPNGFLWQPPSLNNPYNAHISGWTKQDFSEFVGKDRLTVLGHQGLKFYFGPYALRRESAFRFPLRPFSRVISYIAPKISPRLAFAISAWWVPNRSSLDQMK